MGLRPTSGTEQFAAIVFFDRGPLAGVVDAVDVSGAFDDITFTPGARR
ncbi:hypothetical protein [Tautonia plasticadhaerens]|uniref:Uncharacterized protein n=1 Tax=Tautonia plasticadhaerens TaxID=2527974 RepID=A0A518HED2_9BACT|nr:hypothetical protein [Tautonia plasticadhaerens]QDV39192.1 hypothetical protein ElP_71560 [Tautonia plasticadhaerens]